MTWYVLLYTIFNHAIPFIDLFRGAIALTLGYAPVYFVNDYTDREIDKRDKRDNLYNAIRSKNRFMLLGGASLILGLLLSYSIQPISIVFLAGTYLFNAAYSLKPLRLKENTTLRIVSILAIYVLKSYLIITLLRFPLVDAPTLLIALMGSISILSIMLYKRRIVRIVGLEYAFYLLFVVTWGLCIITYPEIAPYIFPLVFFFIYIFMRYKTEFIPLFRYQMLYLGYILLVFTLLHI